jgi:hypothetical protein
VTRLEKEHTKRQEKPRNKAVTKFLKSGGKLEFNDCLSDNSCNLNYTPDNLLSEGAFDDHRSYNSIMGCRTMQPPSMRSSFAASNHTSPMNQRMTFKQQMEEEQQEEGT